MPNLPILTFISNCAKMKPGNSNFEKYKQKPKQRTEQELQTESLGAIQKLPGFINPL